MSSGEIFQNALRWIRRMTILRDGEPAVTPQIADHLCTVLDAHSPGPLAMLYAAVLDGRDLTDEPSDTFMDRAVGVFGLSAAVNLLDDLVDGDCNYLPRPGQTGPMLHYMLNQLALAKLCACVPGPVVGAAAASLAGCVEEGYTELMTETWTPELYLRVARALACQQWRAYLSVLWAQTPLERDVELAAEVAGLCGYLVLDIVDDDPRLVSMNAKQQAQVVRSGWALARDNADHRLRSISAPARSALPVLQAYLARVPR